MVQENLFAKPVDILTAPNGTKIDILKVNSLSMRFVKAARVYSAFTGLEASMSPHHPLLRAAQALSVKVYRFETQRLSGNCSYGTKGYYFAVDDVPKVLAQYYEHHYHLKSEKQRGYNSASQELRDWFQNEVLPLKGAFSMSYDPTTPAARKGKLGEQIVKRLLEKFGCTVERPDGMPENSATAIDWLVWENGGLVCVEVKTIKKFMYSHIPIPTFKIPLAKYECYKREAQERGAELELYFVSSEDGRIYAANARILDEGYREGGFEFPVTVEMKDNDPDICFCLDQFTYKWSIEPEDLEALRAIDAEFQSNGVSALSEPVQTMAQARADTEPAQKPVQELSSRWFTSPNGTELEFCPFESDLRAGCTSPDMYVATRKFKAALGYSNSWDEKGFVEQAAKSAQVEPFSREETKYLLARDIPKLLDAFIQMTSTAKVGTSKYRRSEAAMELKAWFNETVMPALYPNEVYDHCKPVEMKTIGSLPLTYSPNGIVYVGENTIGNCSKEVAPPEKPSLAYSEDVSKFICEDPVSAVEEAPAFEPAREESLIGIIERLAQAIGLPVEEILEAVRQLKLRNDPVLKELFGL